MKVELTYYRLGGKYYTSGEYETECEHIFEIHDEVRTMVEECTLPGLTVGHSQYFVTVDVPDHEHNHPRIVMPEDLRKRMQEYEGIPDIFRKF